MPAHLAHDEFFTSLSTLLTTTSQKARGSIFLTQKPLLTDASNTGESSSPSILIRATDGNTNAPNPKSSKAADAKSKPNKPSSQKVKLSTVVAPEELEAFYARYAEVCKAGMTGLKKRDRKRGKAKGKGAAGKVTKA
ncbi:signal recognition particle, SRP9/SRP14 subunit [Aspergillus steynii IBT 23096]|uniref:Signal recognition particle subunit SRP14 n=1 Tax=Aspergillus steynii IBT 23096 TaxID=1392250 RepID=A0A2I2FYR1_9EURO|nr:signal recognition particle, SRP9/SRP14 subunit [Aspergillus steynii IBT 23096]PLB45780.1 signal recognition particle, SRP9/SRP14 subunit [Aspergillus steynii IBT 23096]